jgi:hypothetical protein
MMNEDYPPYGDSIECDASESLTQTLDLEGPLDLEDPASWVPAAPAGNVPVRLTWTFRRTSNTGHEITRLLGSIPYRKRTGRYRITVVVETDGPLKFELWATSVRFFCPSFLELSTEDAPEALSPVPLATLIEAIESLDRAWVSLGDYRYLFHPEPHRMLETLVDFALWCSQGRLDLDAFREWVSPRYGRLWGGFDWQGRLKKDFWVNRIASYDPAQRSSLFFLTPASCYFWIYTIEPQVWDHQEHALSIAEFCWFAHRLASKLLSSTEPCQITYAYFLKPEVAEAYFQATGRKVHAAKIAQAIQILVRERIVDLEKKIVECHYAHDERFKCITHHIFSAGEDLRFLERVAPVDFSRKDGPK